MKTIRIVKSLLFACVLTGAHAQVSFHNTYGGLNSDWGRTVCLTNDGGYMLAGNSLSFVTGFDDMFLVKTDSLGQILWSRNYGESGVGVIYSVQQTADSGYIVAGQYGYGGFIGHILKLDAAGNIQWSKGVSGANRMYGIEQTHDGGYIAIGYGQGQTSNYDMVLVKLDAAGNKTWSHNYGSIYDEEGWSVKQCFDRGYILAGRTYGYGAGDYDAYLVKTDSMGNVAWAKTYGGSLVDYFMDVRQTSDSGFIASGGVNSGITLFSGDAFIVKTKPDGSMIWNRSYQSSSFPSHVYSIVQTVDTGYAFAYAKSGGIELIKLDASGNLSWSSLLGGVESEKPFCIRQAPDRGFVIAGQSQGVSTNPFDYFMLKTDSTGNTSACVSMPGNPQLLSQPVTVDSGWAVFNGPTVFDQPVSPNTPPALIHNQCFGAGISAEEQKSAVSIYPNPFTTQTSVKIAGTGTYLLLLTDLYGKVIRTLHSTQQEFSVYRENLPAGIYFFQVREQEQIIHTGKIIIE